MRLQRFILKEAGVLLSRYMNHFGEDPLSKDEGYLKLREWARRHVRDRCAEAEALGSRPLSETQRLIREVTLFRIVQTTLHYSWMVSRKHMEDEDIEYIEETVSDAQGDEF